MEVGDSGRSATGRKRCRTAAVVRSVAVLSDGTGCESKGAFTPTKTPCNRMCNDNPKVDDVGEGGREEQISHVTERFERRGSWSERTLPAFVSVSVVGRPPAAEAGIVRYPSSHRSKFSRMVLVVKARALSLRPTAPAIECARTVRRPEMPVWADLRGGFVCPGTV
jgi:hypothetical protein